MLKFTVGIQAKIGPLVFCSVVVRCEFLDLLSLTLQGTRAILKAKYAYKDRCEGPTYRFHLRTPSSQGVLPKNRKVLVGEAAQIHTGLMRGSQVPYELASFCILQG